VQRFEDFTDNLAIYHRMVQESQPDLPLFLLGHSLGGLIGSLYLLDHQAAFKGAILSAPAVKISDSVTPSTIRLSKILSKLAPRAGVLALNTQHLSHDPAVVQAYENDPLVFHGKTPARLAAEILRAMQRVTAEAGTLRLPLLLLQGGDDRIVDPGGAAMLYEKASSPDKTLKVYPGLYHEIFNEPERAQVLADVAGWLDNR
jgi:alpha-beta hydrolase superfamily lysophospholipase